MTKEELFALPPSAAIRAIYDCMDDETIASLHAAAVPKEPLAPKFDRRIFRKEGFMWASECNLESLTFWRNRALEGAANGGQYADRNSKDAKELGYWTTWREWHPDITWSGERDRVFMVANPPNPKPYVYPRTSSGKSGGTPGGNAPSGGGGFEDKDYSQSDDSIPF